jgi:ActR/RegA family two-component response regulator
MAAELESMAASARHLARNPLGIIALFIVLIYGFASLVVGLSDNLSAGERLPMIWFLLAFPVFVLCIFAWLVSRHHAKLYSPADYRHDSAFIEASVEQVEVAAAVRAAAARKLPSNLTTAEFTEETRLAAHRVAKVVTPNAVRSSRSRRILWVDDHHHENSFERDALHALGFQIVLAETTDEALSMAVSNTFDLVVSDMNRRGEPKAGLSLLTKLRANGVDAQYIIYSALSPAQQSEAWKRGALGTTNKPDDLVLLALEAVALRSKPVAA